MMPSDNIITAEKLSKSYRIWENPARRLINPILGKFGQLIPGEIGRAMRNKATLGYQDFFALQGIDFELKRGEAVGIVGRNGAGKSTLLQLIAGTLQPTSGSIEVHGRVAALLELGAGFNVDFTGRENVFLSGAILGLSQKEMESRFDDVAAFADIGDFIDQPVKTYSSGMMMRLAFAVNTCVDPDILIVDEALSVGDAPFQSKCFRRLRKLIDQGVSLLFVSHDLGTVRSICSRALWLKEGQTEMWGDAKDVAKAYEKFCWAEQGVLVSSEDDQAHSEDNSSSSNPSPDTTAIPEYLFTPNPTFDTACQGNRIGTGVVRIDNFIITKADGIPTVNCDYNELLEFHFRGHICAPVDSDIVLSIRFHDLQGNYVFAAHDIYQPHRLIAKKGDSFYAKFSLSLPLHHQEYGVNVGIFGFQGGDSKVKGTYDFSLADLWDVIDDAAFLRVNPCPIMPLPGPVHVTTTLSFNTLSKHTSL